MIAKDVPLSPSQYLLPLRAAAPGAYASIASSSFPLMTSTITTICTHNPDSIQPTGIVCGRDATTEKIPPRDFIIGMAAPGSVMPRNTRQTPEMKARTRFSSRR